MKTCYNTTKYVWIIVGYFIFFSCGQKNAKTYTKELRIQDSSLFIHFPTPDTFLNTWSISSTIVFQWPSEPRTLHPLNEVHGGKLTIYGLTHNTLMTFDPKTHQLKPDLCSKEPEIFNDGKAFRYKLSSLPKFDDGSPVSAADVIFSFKAATCALVNNPNMKAYLDFLDSIASPDEQTVELFMKGKYILNAYMASEVPVLQEKKYDPNHVLQPYSIRQLKDAANIQNNTVLQQWADRFNGPDYSNNIEYLTGSGPYKITAWNVGQEIILEKKNNHWTDESSKQNYLHEAHPEKIIFKVMTDEEAIKLALKKQEIDVTTTLSTKALLELQKDKDFNKNYHSAFVDFINYSYIAMNCRPDGVKRKKLFTEPKVRRAMALLTPIDQIIEIIYQGKAQRQIGPVSPLKKSYNKNLQPIPFNPEKASLLLDECGWVDTDKNGIRDKMIDGQKVEFSFELVYQATNSVTKDIADLIAESMKSAGVNARPTAWDMNTTITKATQHDFDMFMGAFNGTLIPDDFKQLWHTQSWAEGGANFSGFGDAASDALIDSIRTEMDEEKRKAMTLRFQQRVYDDQPVIFVISTFRKIAVHKRFGNVNMYFERPGVLLNELIPPQAGTAKK
ncbi:MAG: peptide ABC transporter substrate-binding protein [Flavobacteriales bacterium]|nr:peptide ABC transporter substrate-binding protein [Flavobacteriales bacterium]